MSSTDSQEASVKRTRWWSLVRREKHRTLDLVIAICSVILTLAAFIFNMGWIRLIILFTTVPVLAMLLYMSVSLSVYGQRWKAPLFYAASVLHPLSYMLLYDSGDRAPAYLFFGLIPVEGATEDLAKLLAVFAFLSFWMSVGFMLALLVQFWRSRKRSAPNAPAEGA